MKFKSTQHFFVFAVIAIIFFSFSSQHPVGRSGAPGDGLCSDCHGGSGGGFDGDITLTGIPSDAIPGQVYPISINVDVTMGSPIRGGFQIVALKNSDDTQAGVWSNNDGNSSFRTSGGRTYFGHNPAQNFSGGNANWSADWEAPVIDDDVTFYMASILGNGSLSSGDKLIVNTLVTTIEAMDPIVITFSDIVATSCFDGDDGQAVGNVSGGTPPYTFTWESGEMGMMASGLSAGTNTLTVMDDNGVSASAMVTIPEPDAIESAPIVENVSCFGDEDGSIDVNPFGGTGSLTCDWGPSFGTGCFQENLEVGSYFITVSDENNCEAIIELEITEPDLLEVNLTATDATSQGNDGSISARGLGGTRPYTFRWSTGIMEMGNSSLIDGLSAGDYQLTVTDTNGCSVETMATVGGASCDLVLMSNISHVACYGDSTGLISIDVQGVSTGVTFNWSTGDTTNTISDLPAGLYDVVVTQDMTCADTLIGLEVIQPDSLQAQVTLLVNPSCETANNGRLNLNIFGGTPGYDLTWSNGLINDTIITGMDTVINLPDTLTQLNVGTYAYTITDLNGCVIEDSIMLNNSDLLPPFINVQDIIVVLDANGFAKAISFAQIDTGTFDNCEIDTIIFDTGDFDCSDIGINEFPVIVTDGNGNSSSEIVSITVLDETPPVIDCSASSTSLNTCGAVSYTIPTAIDNCDIPLVELIEGQPSGTVFPVGTTLVVYAAIDECGNSSTCSFDVTVANDLVASIEVQDASCANNDGSLIVNVSGGLPPYSIQPTTLTDLPSGDYEIEVVDANGCVYLETVTIEQEDNDILVSILSTDASCFDSNDGSVMVDVEGGSGSFNFDYGFGIHPDTLAAGIYELTVTDSITGCEAFQTFEIGSPDEFDFNITNFETNACTGEIVAVISEVNGGVMPISADTIITADSYSITLTDALGCTAMASLPQTLVTNELVISSTDITPSDNTNNGAISVIVEGGVLPYAYIWTNSAGEIFSTDQNVVDLEPGDYLFQVTDANGCIITQVFMVDFMSSVINLDKDDAFVKIYPNPVTNEINLDFIKSNAPESITIYNTNGQRVVDLKKSNAGVIDVSELNAGLYYVRLLFEDVEVVKKIIKL